MTELRIDRVDNDAAVTDWRHVHNVVIPTAVLSLDEVRERVERNHLQVGYLGDTPVGCTTVRPSPGRPDGPVPAGTFLASAMPEGRGGSGVKGGRLRPSLAMRSTLDA